MIFQMLKPKAKEMVYINKYALYTKDFANSEKIYRY